MIASERFERIMGLVAERGIVGTKELAQLMDVTETTIRRDSEELERQGKVLRVHGGIKRVDQRRILSSTTETAMCDRVGCSTQKEMVCEKAASFVHDGDCVFLDGGTSLVPMVKYLQGKHVRIVTHSHLIAQVFQDPDSELFLLGGKYLPRYGMSVGPMTLADLSHFNFDHTFIGCAGIDIARQMVYTAELDTMMVKEQVLGQSVHNYLLVDSSKLSVRGFYSFTPSIRFDAVVCDAAGIGSQQQLPENFILV